MGSLTLPSSGPVYADAQIFIHSVEKHPVYAPLLRLLWESVAREDLEVVSSELTLLETLVGPLKTGDSALVTDYENIFVTARRAGPARRHPPCGPGPGAARGSRRPATSRVSSLR